VTDVRSLKYSAGIAQRYSAGLLAGWSGVRVLTAAGNFSLHRSVQTGSGALPASYPMGTRGSSSAGKAAGAWSWPLTFILCRGQECADLYLHSPNTPFLVWRSFKVWGQLHLYKFVFTIITNEISERSWPGHEADNSPRSSAEVKECVELYFHSPFTASWCGA
jgi:hypothetical protein